MIEYSKGALVWVKPLGIYGTITSKVPLCKGVYSYLVEWLEGDTRKWKCGWYEAESLSYTKIEEGAFMVEAAEPLEGAFMQKTTISDGGPSSYYDFPDNWNTLNDFIEDKSVHQWKGFSFHLGNIVKAVTRWGDKDGTSIEYDSKKIIYSGCRVLMMIVGKEKLRTYLRSLLDDPQFRQE